MSLPAHRFLASIYRTPSLWRWLPLFYSCMRRKPAPPQDRFRSWFRERVWMPPSSPRVLDPPASKLIERTSSFHRLAIDYRGLREQPETLSLPPSCHCFSPDPGCAIKVGPKDIQEWHSRNRFSLQSIRRHRRRVRTSLGWSRKWLPLFARSVRRGWSPGSAK